MNKDELKEKADRLKERVKEAFGDTKKKAEGYMDRAREGAHEKSDKAKESVPQRDVPQDEDDE